MGTALRKCSKCKKRPLSSSRASICRHCYDNRPRKGKKTYGTCPICKVAPLTTNEAKRCATCFANRGKTGQIVPARVCQLCAAPVSKAARFCAECVRTRRHETEATRVATAGVPLEDGIRAALKGGAKDAQAISGLVGHTPGQVLDAILAMQTRGMNLHELGGKWSIERAPDLGSAKNITPYVSRKNGHYRFGWLGDTHLCSKYQRLDVLRDLYKRFADADLDRIFHAGNWIDGEARFNKFDLLVHGMDAQVRYLRDEYPAIDGLTTYSVAGDDHEGWYSQREGVDIGKYAENEMRDGGRTDWVNLGYMEAFVPLQHAVTGKTNQLHLVHPGGGSSYATSYTVQKLVESYSGGSKPAVLLAGHYHKLEFINVRNVWCLQTGCTQDQTPFARKKRLHYALGGGVMDLEQDSATGAIIGASVQMWHYFDLGYYGSNRFSLHGDVQMGDVGVGGIKQAS